MSSMEIFHGYFEKIDSDIEVRDDDDFYELEEKLGYYIVNVDGQLYKFWSSNTDLDEDGFSVVLPATDKPQLLCYWYNGGAGLHEVVEEAIRSYVENK